MAELKKQDDLKVAVQVNGEAFISEDNGILYENITDDLVFLYIKSEDGTKEIKIKITKK